MQVLQLDVRILLVAFLLTRSRWGCRQNQGCIEVLGVASSISWGMMGWGIVVQSADILEMFKTGSAPSPLNTMAGVRFFGSGAGFVPRHVCSPNWWSPRNWSQLHGGWHIVGWDSCRNHESSEYDCLLYLDLFLEDLSTEKGCWVLSNLGIVEAVHICREMERTSSDWR